jgi:predicted O-methyltransferase YrrM
MNHNPIWKSDASFTLAETEFLMMHNPEDLKRLETTNERFLLGKTRNLVTNTVAMRDSESIKQIVDLGIYKGGSIALYALLFMPLKLVGIEYSKEPVEPLNNFIAKNGLQKQVSTYYGVNQADSKQLRQIVGAEFGGVELDLVVDDASHYYAETRSSFETLFPMLRPGGIYIIEDWGWAHWAGDEWQKSKYFSSKSPSLTNLLIEISMLCASRPDLVASLQIEQSVIAVRRGSAKFEPGDFKLEQKYLNRGKKFKPIM